MQRHISAGEFMTAGGKNHDLTGENFLKPQCQIGYQIRGRIPRVPGAKG
jgi:hypothetical protein